MSKLEELIKELCPNGMEYVELQKVCDFNRGTSITSKEVKGGDVPVVSGGQQPAFYHNVANREANSITIAGSGAYAGYVSFWEEPIFCADSFTVDVKDKNKLDKRYLYHFLLNKQNYIYSRKQGAGIPHVHGKDIARLQIPLPPLAVQREIVRILDKFTLYSQELAAELAARRVQYGYYRDKLLSYNNAVEYYSLNTLAKFTYGYTDKAKDSGDVRFIRITDINDDGCLCKEGAKYIDITEDNKKYLLKKGDLLLARTGATYGRTLYVPDDSPAIYASFLIKIALDNSKILNRYYWHFSKSRLYWQQAEKLVSVGGQQQFNTNAVGRVIVPLPPLEIQERIVKVLDNFDAICSDLGIGLPAEIEARQRQYEYYRDKLLQF